MGEKCVRMDNGRLARGDSEEMAWKSYYERLLNMEKESLRNIEPRYLPNVMYSSIELGPMWLQSKLVN